MDESYNRKWRFLSAYTAQKMRLRRLQRQREEYIVLRGKANALGTVIQQGRTSDTTCDAALQMLDNADKIERRIAEICETLAAITEYIESAPVTETEKLILTCRFIQNLHPAKICIEIGDDESTYAAMQKRIKRIVRKMPEPKTKKRL